MKLFASKKEAAVTAGIAAFFFLAALAFTFEPLVTLILSSRTLPGDTAVSLHIPSGAEPGEVVAETVSSLMAMGFTVPQAELMSKIADLAGQYPPSGRLAIAPNPNKLPYSLAIETAAPAAEIISRIKQLLARLSPSEIKTRLPDDTFMTEIVIEPNAIQLDTAYPQINIQEKTLGSAIFINFPQGVDAHGFETPLSCRLAKSNIKEVSYDAQRRSLAFAVFHSIMAYLKDFSCFQSFSTFNL